MQRGELGKKRVALPGEGDEPAAPFSLAQCPPGLLCGELSATRLGEAAAALWPWPWPGFSVGLPPGRTVLVLWGSAHILSRSETTEPGAVTEVKGGLCSWVLVEEGEKNVLSHPGSRAANIKRKHSLSETHRDLHFSLRFSQPAPCTLGGPLACPCGGVLLTPSSPCQGGRWTPEDRERRRAATWRCPQDMCCL